MKKLIALIFVFVVLFAGVACEHHRARGPEITSTYVAVLLDNNQSYYGKLANADSPFPVLTDVYYIQSAVNQETKAVSNVLVRRGSEWHGPDRMFLNARHIVFIEPVGADSKVAQLIADDKKKH